MPKNWKTYKLAEVADVIDSLHKTPKYSDSGYPMIRAQEIVGGNLKIEGAALVSKEVFDDFSKNHSSQIGDLVFSRVGAHSGKVSYVNTEIPFCLGQNTVFITPKLIDNRFLYYNLSSPLSKQQIEQQAVVSSYKTISLKTIRGLHIKMPPLPEQKAIASILSAIDDKIENNLAMNKTLEDMAMALYKHWFVDFGQELENTLADYVNLNPRLSIKKGELASYVNMKALPTEGMSVSEVDKVVVKGGAKFQNGDTLLARITPCLENGKTAFVDFLDENEIGFGSTEFLVLRAKEGISKYWVYCLSRDINLVNHAVSCMIGTSGRQRVQNDPFLQYELPEINEETMVSFEKKVEPWFKKVKANTNENQTLTKLRDTLLPKLISGEVRLKEFEEEITAAL